MSTSVALSPVARQLFLNPSNGAPASGFKLFTYAAGTTTKLNTYKDSAGATENTNPIIMDTLGECDLWLEAGQSYKLVFAYPTDGDPPTNPIWTRDGITASGGGAGGNGSTFDTTADLLAAFPSSTTLAPNFQATTFGRGTIGDGGGGQFWYNAADTSTADNGGTIRVDNAGRHWYFVPVNGRVDWRVFGAISGQDSSAAVQLAINAWAVASQYSDSGFGALYAPTGYWYLTGLSVTKSGLNIEGDGITSTYLVNSDPSAQMFVYNSGAAIAYVSLRQLQMRNIVSRGFGSLPLIDLTSAIRWSLVDVRFTSAPLSDDSHLSPVYCNMLRITTGFEFEFDRVYFQYGKGRAMEIVDGGQADTVIFQNSSMQGWLGTMTLWCGSANSCTNFIWNSGKLLGFQGGSFIANGDDALCETTVQAGVTNSNTVSLTSVTGIQVDRTLVIGQNTINPAVAHIVGIAGNTLTLDRAITCTTGQFAIAGTILCVLGHMLNAKFSGVQMEGADVGVLSSGAENIMMGNWSVSSVIKPVYLNNQYRGFGSLFPTLSTVGTPHNAQTWKMLTENGMTDKNNRALLMGNGMAEGSGYFSGTALSLVDNRTTHSVFNAVEDRNNGMEWAGGNAESDATFGLLVDNTYFGFNLVTQALFSRLKWQFQSADYLFADLTNQTTTPDLRFAFDAFFATPSFILFGASGNVGVGSVWNQPHFQMGGYHLWVDSSGRLRIKAGAPTSDTDGVVVGTQT